MEPHGSRVAAGQNAEVCCDVLDSPEIKACIGLLKDITLSSFGPQGRLKSIQNCSGGHLTLTSSSLRLFGALSVSKPVLKLVLGSVQGHINTYRDGGLFAALLSLTLIDSSLRLPIRRGLIADLYDCFLRLAQDYLQSADCRCKHALSTHSLDSLLKLASSVVGAKPLCGLYGGKLDHMSRLLVEAFLKSLPESPSQGCGPEHIHLVTRSGFPVTESECVDGVLLDTSCRDVSCVETINSTRPGHVAGSRGSIPVGVVNVSMSGDLEDFVEADGYEVSCDVNVDRVSTNRLLSFAEALLDSGAKVVFCQKVVCPEVRAYLKGQGILVIDRLGGGACRTVQQYTGAAMFSCVSAASVDPACLGTLTEITVETCHNKSYLLLKSSSAKDVTVVLCNSHDEMVEELKVVSEGVIQSMYCHLDKPQLLTGAGCWQTHLANHLRQQVLPQAETLRMKYHVSKSQLRDICESFCHSLELCAMALNKDGYGHMTDQANHHLWIGHSDETSGGDVYKTCSCGEFTKGEITQLTDVLTSSVLGATFISPSKTDEEERPRRVEKVAVVDSFPVQLNALQTAVMTANAVLGITQYIKNTN